MQQFNNLTVSTHRLGVKSLPVSSGRTTNGVVGSVTLNSQTSVFAAGRSQTTSLSVLVDRVADPVNTSIVSDIDVVRINNDNLVVFVGGILVDPIRVQHSHVTVNTSDSFLSNTSQVSCEFKLVDTGVLWLTEGNSLRTVVDVASSTTTTNSGTNNGESLFGFVSKLVSLISSSRAVDLS